MLCGSNTEVLNRDILHKSVGGKAEEAMLACGTMLGTVTVVVRISLPSFFNSSQTTVNFLL